MTTKFLRRRAAFRGADAALGPLLLGFLVLFATGAAAQESDPVLLGHVVKGGEPVANVPVTLHRVSSEGSGEVAADVSGSDGSFSFPLETVDGATFTVFFVAADHLSVRYLGEPVHGGETGEGYTVAVYDTTSVAREPVRITRRDMVLIPESGGSWEVNEVVRIFNPSSVALVADTGMPTWEFGIPGGAAEFQTGEGDILPNEVSRMDDRVLLLTPVVPGERDLFIRYRLQNSPGNATIPLNQPTDSLNLFVRQPSHLTAVEGMASIRLIEAQGEEFLLYAGDAFQPGEEITLRWSGASPIPIDPVHAAIGVTVLLLLAGVWSAVRNRPQTPR